MPNSHMTFGVDLLPKTNAQYNLGNSAQKWNLYVDKINGAPYQSDLLSTTVIIPASSWTKTQDNYYTYSIADENITADHKAYAEMRDTYYNLFSDLKITTVNGYIVFQTAIAPTATIILDIIFVVTT